MNYCCLFKLLLIDIITLKEPINENIKKNYENSYNASYKKKRSLKSGCDTIISCLIITLNNKIFNLKFKSKKYIK